MEVFEEIITMYRENQISLKEAADKVIGVIYKNPLYFKLDKMTEDQRSDFILRIYSKAEQIIKAYDPSKSLFTTYLATSMMTIRKSQYKSLFKEAAQQKACEEYAEEEYLLNVADEESEYTIEQKPIDRRKLPDDVRAYLTSCLPKIPDSTKIMMLALKSEHFITAEHIHKLHAVTGLKEKEILEMFLKLRNTIQKKKESYIHRKELHNQSYILKKRFSFMLENMDKKTNYYETIKKSNKYQEKNWKKQTEMIKSANSIIPSNSDVSKILGISDPQIRRLQNFIEGFEKSHRKKH